MAKETTKYSGILENIIDSVYHINKVGNNKAVSDAYRDTYMTEQQRKRDKKVTELLEQYVAEYEYKNKNNKWYKNILFGTSMVLLVLFCGVFLGLISSIDFNAENVSVEAMVQVISVCITFLTLIVGILTIITKNVFPENEQEYITRIVEILYYERIRGNCKNGYMVTTGQHEEHKEEDRMKESTKESIDKAIEDVSSQIRKLDISDTDYADNVRALAALISARAQISD